MQTLKAISLIFFTSIAIGVQAGWQDLPIVQQTTSRAGVTSTYQDIMKKVDSFSSFLQSESVDLDQSVTDEALNGLFEVVAQEEKRIRDDPVARSWELLKKVFDF
ncbi:DUF4197 family protein [Halieaceae bacterium IMCC8485]|uniref:DUF4197 family protein n=1 Tax=Candidatus Seongchinamella marina TaxID=2518990 RepID=A0ABT3SWK9_9GAMM|nr:DUF4197 family protein [Candidatus Seongchinamella marina]MCX2974269.1 DUF4197 family protein [Candidatus Seongchinamella marina]